MTASELENLLAEVTPGEWVADGNGILTTKRESYLALCIGMGTRRSDEAVRNARLIAMAPTLARKVIAAEKLVEALRDAEWVIGNTFIALAVNRRTGKLTDPSHDICEALAAWEAAQ